MCLKSTVYIVCVCSVYVECVYTVFLCVDLSFLNVFNNFYRGMDN